jgi:hypothetical protein
MPISPPGVEEKAKFSELCKTHDVEPSMVALIGICYSSDSNRRAAVACSLPDTSNSSHFFGDLVKSLRFLILLGITVVVHAQAGETLRTSLEGEARLECMEPELAVTLKGASLDAVEMQVEITPDHLTQEHKFTFSIDQRYLDPLSSQCARLLQAFPIRGV